MNKYILLFLSGGMLLAFMACSDLIDERPLSDLGFGYYPLAIGKYWEYAIDSTIYDDNGAKIIQTQSFIREEITDTLTDAEGNMVYIIERSWKETPTDSWQAVHDWSASYYETQGIRTENNLRFIKIIFPPKPGIVWDGNIYIDDRILLNVAGESVEAFKNWQYEVLAENAMETIDGVEYSNLVTVGQADDENLIERRYSLEKYALDIGLVYREMQILDTQCIEPCAALTWEEKAQRGFILKQSLTNHN